MSTTHPMISVQTVLQAERGEPLPILHQQHRVAGGTTIRELLRQAGLDPTVTLIESGALGLALHGQKAWLDDVLRDGSRVEVLEPVNANAKAARAERVAADRGRRKTRFGAGR